MNNAQHNMLFYNSVLPMGKNMATAESNFLLAQPAMSQNLGLLQQIVQV